MRTRMDLSSNGKSSEKPPTSIEQALAGVITNVGKKKAAIAVVAIYVLAQMGAAAWMIFALAVVAIGAQLLYDLVAVMQWLAGDDLSETGEPAAPAGHESPAPGGGK